MLLHSWWISMLCGVVTGTGVDTLSRRDEKLSEMMWQDCSSCPQREGESWRRFCCHPFVKVCACAFCVCTCTHFVLPLHLLFGEAIAYWSVSYHFTCPIMERLELGTELWFFYGSDPTCSVSENAPSFHGNFWYSDVNHVMWLTSWWKSKLWSWKPGIKRSDTQDQKLMLDQQNKTTTAHLIRYPGFNAHLATFQ